MRRRLMHPGLAALIIPAMLCLPHRSFADTSASEQTQPSQAQAATSQDSAAHKASNAEELRERWGVDDIVLRYTAAGYFLDLRFRVVDKDKSKFLFDSTIKPRIIDHASKAELIVPTPPKVGSLRNTRIQNVEVGKIYTMVFANPGHIAKPGNLVSLVLGDFRAENLIIQ